jgi:hypothetical protein
LTKVKRKSSDETRGKQGQILYILLPRVRNELSQDALRLEFGDVLGAVAENRLQDTAVSAVECRRGAFDTRWRPREFEARPFDYGGDVNRISI